jgi:hypothetical protein
MARIFLALAVLILPLAAEARGADSGRPTLTSVKKEIYAFVECLGKRYEAASAFSENAATIVSQAFSSCSQEESELRAAAEAKFNRQAAAGVVASVRARARVTVIELVAESKLRAGARRAQDGFTAGSMSESGRE